MQNYTPGTVIYVWMGFYWHYGIISGFNGLGELTVISNSKQKKRVVEESLTSFCSGRKPIVKGYPSNLPPGYVVERARSQVGKKYELLSHNCEHFRRWVHQIKPESPQIQSLVWVISSLLLVTVAARAAR